jgi:hypothetical protein
MELLTYMPSIMAFLVEYVKYMLIYFGVKSVLIGFNEKANLEITWKSVLIYPVYAARDIGYGIGRTAIFILGLFMD